MSVRPSASILALLLLAVAVAATNKAYRLAFAEPSQYLDASNCAEILATTGLRCDEVALLTERERLLVRHPGPPRKRVYKLEPSESYDADEWRTSAGYKYLSAAGREVEVSNVIPPPQFRVLSDTSSSGSIIVSNGSKDDQVYFEFDVERTFDSPQLWRWPALKPGTVEEDRDAPLGAQLDLFNFATANTSGLSRQLSLPFPLELMAAPYLAEEPLQAMQILVALAKREVKRAGLDIDQNAEDAQIELARMIHRYVQHSFLIGSDSYTKPPVETFLARNGECGNLNTLAQALIELSGMRARLVSGFSPTIREIKPVSGHTLLEVNYADGWGILDTYLDLFAPDVSTANLEGSALASKVVLGIDNSRFDPKIYGTSVTLGQIFRFRLYGDGAQRMPMQSLLQLGSAHASFGLDWPEREGASASSSALLEAVPDSIEVYVRARFVRSRCVGRWNYSCADENAKASEWSVQQITLTL